MKSIILSNKGCSCTKVNLLWPKHLRAFTLIELMVVVAIAIVITLVAIPSFSSVVANNKALSVTNDLVISLSYARSEAIKRATSVSICPTNAGFTACSTDWTQGWIVFVNPDQNGTFNNDATEILLRAHEAIATNTTIASAPTLNFLTFDSRGFPTAGTPNVSLTITAANCKGDNIRSIQISATGRLAQTQAACP